jgi:hypothetical protein
MARVCAPGVFSGREVGRCPPPSAGRRDDRVAVSKCRVRVAWSMVTVLLGWVAFSLLPSL